MPTGKVFPVDNSGKKTSHLRRDSNILVVLPGSTSIRHYQDKKDFGIWEKTKAWI